MKLALQIFAFLTIFGIIYLAIINGHDSMSLQLAAPHYDAASEMMQHTSKNVGIAFYTLTVLCAGIISGLCLFTPFYLTQTEQLYAYKRELEKNSVKTESSNSQVKVLEAKVKVLEKALKEALKH